MKQSVVYTNIRDVQPAILDIQRKLSGFEPNVLVFFAASCFDFENLSASLKSAFPHAEILGTSTAGEISQNGFMDNTLLVSALKTNHGTRVSGVVFDQAGKFPYIHKKSIMNAVSAAGISRNARDAFAFMFINAGFNAEESVLALIHLLLGDDFKVCGGTAGHDGTTETTYVCYNGTVVKDGAAILFVRTSDRFDIYRENIFTSTKKAINITDADTEKRIIKRIDGQNPTSRYCEMLGISKAELIRTLDDHPFGRVFGNHVFLSSLASFNPDGTINMYSRVLPNTPVEILQVIDPIETANKTIERSRSVIQNPGACFMVNCLQRTTRFQKMNITDKLTQIYKSQFDNYAGFTCYGEQINRVNSNQTLVMLVVEE